MIAAQLSSALRTLQESPLGRSGAQAWDRVLSTSKGKVPLATAIDAPRHEIATSDAGTISYYADTRAGGRPLVLLHGIHAAASAYEMRPLFESFRGERRVYALDLPGFGFSERSARAYTPATYVHAIEHLLRNVASEEGADVIALSLTGEYAAKVAVEMPELVRSLALISPTGFASPDQASQLERRSRRSGSKLAAKYGGSTASRLLYDLLVTRPSLRYFLRKSFEGRVDDGVFAYAFATSHQPGAYRAPMSFVLGGLFPTGEATSRYAHVRVPSLVLYDRDPHTSFTQLEPFTSEHPNFRAQRIAPTRGLPHFDAPQQTAEALRSFYRQLDQPTSPTNGIGSSSFVGSA